MAVEVTQLTFSVVLAFHFVHFFLILKVKAFFLNTFSSLFVYLIVTVSGEM